MPGSNLVVPTWNAVGGGHFYDIPDIREQLTQQLKPLTDEMKNNYAAARRAEQSSPWQNGRAESSPLVPPADLSLVEV